MNRPFVPPEYAMAVERMFGEPGRVWASDLPALLEEVTRDWGVEYAVVLPDLSINYVIPGRLADGTEVIVKACPPNPEVATEIGALRLFAEGVCVRLIDVDERRGVMVLERLRPGIPLTDLIGQGRDDDATVIAAELMRGLGCATPPGHGFPTLEKWAHGLDKLRPHFGGGTGPFPVRLLEMAESLFRDLLRSPDQVLLHGDLHHGNILAARRKPWLIIDPKGVVGDPAYDAATFMGSLGADSGQLELTKSMIDRRCSILSDLLQFDRERLLAWGIARTVLSAWWCVESGCDCAPEVIALAEMIAEVRC